MQPKWKGRGQVREEEFPGITQEPLPAQKLPWLPSRRGGGTLWAREKSPKTISFYREILTYLQL